MPSADVAVVGAGLAGLTCAVELAERGARVFLAAKGMAATHWSHGGLDLAAPRGAATARDGLGRLAATPGHPYAMLADALPAALEAQASRLAALGLPHRGGLDDPLVAVPTAIGTLRPAACLPAAQAALLEPWERVGLLLVGFAGYRDAWPAYAARNLVGRPWPGGPATIRAIEVALPGLASLRNLNARTLALQFDDAAWRGRALRAVTAAIPRGRWRIGLPAVLGLADHAAAFAEATAALGTAFEMVSVPPSMPGIRLFEALRRQLLARGGRMQWGFGVVDVERDGDRVVAIHTEGASRTLRIAADEFVLATGGIAGGGIRAAHDGTLVERVFGLPVSAPGHDAWFGTDPLAAQPIETAGIEVDRDLRPSDGPHNVRVIGSALAGMRYLDERCGDGVAIASAHRAAELVGRPGAIASVPRRATA